MYMALLTLNLVLIFWCGSKSNNQNTLYMSKNWINLEYNSRLPLENVELNKDDLPEIIWLYQETWENIWYKDSLLIAEKYALWMWVNAFAQKNLDWLEHQWLSLSDINKNQIWIRSNSWDINGVLIEYNIISWFNEVVPILYLSQLFIPYWENVILYSYVTEDKNSRANASNMFKSIK